MRLGMGQSQGSSTEHELANISQAVCRRLLSILGDEGPSVWERQTHRVEPNCLEAGELGEVNSGAPNLEQTTLALGTQ